MNYTCVDFFLCITIIYSQINYNYEMFLLAENFTEYEKKNNIKNKKIKKTGQKL